MTGQWPPEWDDPDDITEEAGQRDAETEAGLSEVAAYLASVPAPVMPGSVEARISAALAVEAAARSGIATPASGDAKGNGTVKSDGPVQPDSATGARVLGPAPARARVRRPEGRRTRREREMRKIFEARPERDIRKVLGRFVLGPLAVCLLVAVIAVGLSHAGSSSSSSSANSAAGAPRAAGAASSAPAASSGFGYSSAASGALAPVPAASAPRRPPRASRSSRPVPATSGRLWLSRRGPRYLPPRNENPLRPQRPARLRRVPRRQLPAPRYPAWRRRRDCAPACSRSPGACLPSSLTGPPTRGRLPTSLPVLATCG